MHKNFIVIFFIAIALAGLIGGYYALTNKQYAEGLKSPVATNKNGGSIFESLSLSAGNLFKSKTTLKNVNILLLGIDRRSKAEGYRTDTMVLVTVNPKDNKVVLVSIPRDLWWDGGRINAVFRGSGWQEMQNAFETITGIRPDHYIVTDFEDFTWLVDAMGGVPVNVQTTFTDYQYPVDATLEYQTVTFTQGHEKLTGERALIFSRSRKGDFDNGDWGRMKRQHQILKGMVDAVLQPESVFNPMVVEKAFELVTTNRMDTNLTVDDAKALWDFYKDKDLYTVQSMYFDMSYLFTPPAAEYGGAWVLAPIEGNYERFKSDISAQLYVAEVQGEETGSVQQTDSSTSQ